nr:MAG TPA: hypothetical protein [Caudoviricetes sp.]
MKLQNTEKRIFHFSKMIRDFSQKNSNFVANIFILISRN